MISGSGLRGAGRSKSAELSWKQELGLGAGVWGGIAVLGWWLRSGSPKPRLGDLRLLYYLAGTNAVDAYLVGGARILLLVLHLLVATAVGGGLALALLRLGLSPLRAALAVLLVATLVQALCFVPVS